MARDCPRAALREAERIAPGTLPVVDAAAVAHLGSDEGPLDRPVVSCCLTREPTVGELAALPDRVQVRTRPRGGYCNLLLTIA